MFYFYYLVQYKGTESNLGNFLFTLSTMETISSGIRDFQEVIVITCGTYFSRGDLQKYKFYRNQLLLLNTSLYCLFMIIMILFMKPFYNCMNLEDNNRKVIIKLSYYFLFLFAPLITISNFMKGMSH